MAKRSLKPQLNQIRAWVRQGRTDAWIAHQLEIGTAELREFRRQHGLSADEEDGTAEVDLRDEIEAEIAEATEGEDDGGETDGEEESGAGGEESDAAAEESDAVGEPSDDAESEGRPRRRRRRGRRGGRGRGRAELEAAFDHGEEGIGLWLDPAVQEDPAYAQHWAGHREVTVRIEPDQIVIRRTGSSDDGDASGDD